MLMAFLTNETFKPFYRTSLVEAFLKFHNKIHISLLQIINHIKKRVTIFGRRMLKKLSQLKS